MRTFGQWLGLHIRANAGGHGLVMKLGFDYFNVDSIVAAAEEIDGVLRSCVFEERRMTRIEQLMFEILVCQAGFKTVAEAQAKYLEYVQKGETSCNDGMNN